MTLCHILPERRGWVNMYNCMFNCIGKSVTHGHRSWFWLPQSSAHLYGHRKQPTSSHGLVSSGDVSARWHSSWTWSSCSIPLLQYSLIGKVTQSLIKIVSSSQPLSTGHIKNKTSTKERNTVPYDYFLSYIFCYVTSFLNPSLICLSETTLMSTIVI